jgi:crotonobetainyl-CoA:carnitine CoA-transferase CaiB-like acyl-CoA transferase
VLARRALEALWGEAGLPADTLPRVELTGADPILPSSFAVGAAMQASIAAAAAAAAAIWAARGGNPQRVAVDMRHAAAEARSERYLRIAGEEPGEIWDRIVGTYRCGDGGWVRLHTNFPNHRDGVLTLLGCDYDREAVTRALGAWSAQDIEDALAAAGQVGSRMRSFAEWDAHPHSAAVAAQPVVTIERVGDAPPRVLPPAARPLAGLRVIDLTRVLAGPVCGRTLAAHGADVLHLSAPHLPFVAVEDTGRGKLTAHVDLRDPAGREALRGLLRTTDVFVQGYRPGGIAGFGFGPEAAAAIRPGIVYVSLSAYGHRGPWAGRRGFDSLVQTATGFNHAEAEEAGTDGPKPLPAQVLDHASGYLMAFGALAALARQASEGGSWLVRVSLVRTGHWLRGLGRIPGGLAAPDPAPADVADLVEHGESGFGTMAAVRHAGQLDLTPPRWDRPAMPLGAHRPRWP